MSHAGSRSHRAGRRLTAIVAAAIAVAASGPGAATSPPEAPVYSLTAWSADRGEPPGDVFAIAQDVEGYLWLGTPTGLVRFDGARFTRWPPDGPPLPNGPVHAIVGAPDGDLWVGFGGGGGIVQLTAAGVVRHTPAAGAPPGVTAMIRERSGAILASGRRGVFRYAEGRWALSSRADGYPGAEAFGLFEDRQNRIWVGTSAGVYRRVDGRYELVDASSARVQDFAEDAGGNVWFTDPVELVRRLPDPARPRLGPSLRLPAGGWRLLHDRTDQIWIAAFGLGLMRVRDASTRSPIIERFEYERKLPGSPRALFEDRDGHLWVGMRGGLLRLTAGSFPPLTQLAGLNNDGVRTTTAGRDGSVWVATGYAVNRFEGATHTVFDVPQTMALHADRRGEIWIATSQAVGRLQAGRIVPLPIAGSPDLGRVTAITTDAHGRAWLCSSLKGASVWNGSRLIYPGDESDVSAGGCQSIYTDRRDRVWVGSLSGGVSVHDRDGRTQFAEKDGLAGGSVLAILEDRRGAMWFSTSSGVSRYANGRFTTITREHAPLVDLVPVLVEDEDGAIWIGVNSGAGILRVSPSELDKVAVNPSYHIEYAHFDESDGLQQGSQTWQSGVGGVRGPDGRLWVATGLGMAIIDPRRLPQSRRTRPPRIEAATVNGDRVQPLAGLTLPHGVSTLAVHFGTINLASARKLQYRYMLDGVDTDWVYAGNGREARYTNLRPGEHRFRVSATDTGPWTESAMWTFVVAPPFYLTRSFFLLLAGGIALALVAAWWLRLRAVRSQFALVFAERARVSREIHDTLLQSLAAIGVELETISTQLAPSESAARQGLYRLRRHVSRSVREARESIVELRHHSMQQRGLADRLRDLAVVTSRTTRTPVEFSCAGRARHDNPDMDLQLLRIAQEAVQNAVKHAGASHIGVTLAYEPACIVLCVSDDGCGFAPDEYDPPPPSGEHLGLVTMRERAARVRGRLTIRSRRGSGTEVTAIVPLDPGSPRS